MRVISKPPDAAGTRAGNGHGAPRKRVRTKPVDGRRREARAWRRHYERSMAETGGRHEQMCRALATLVCERERLDGAVARGEAVDALLLVRVSGEIRRLLTRLGLDADHEVIDGTAQAIDALRAHNEARA